MTKTLNIEVNEIEKMNFIKRNATTFMPVCMIALGIFLLPGCATIPNDQRIDDVPMYGHSKIPSPEYLSQADKDLIKTAENKFGSKEKASYVWTKLAEDYFNEGNYHYAMRRYNQAWLLDPQNYKPYWGFGQIMMAREKYDQAIIYYNKALELVDDKYQKSAVYKDIGAAYAGWARNQAPGTAKRAKYFKMAHQHFKKSAKLDASYTPAWEAWATSLYEEGKYAEAWKIIKKARSTGIDVPPKLIKKLTSKMPEPK